MGCTVRVTHSGELCQQAIGLAEGSEGARSSFALTPVGHKEGSGMNPVKTSSREGIPRRNQVRNEFCINIKSGRNPAKTSSREGIPQRHPVGKESRKDIKPGRNPAKKSNRK
ncbi:hypothetical protein JCGZ_16946 [Jatropha curcas]|uniref:Uncharacterized protein n=1 Tax=Jatropha curcas TaxID=180498 RepID=A0A067KFF6_JATCU|nr:hypothetical protein JCGZ_16946 [Jatropha curcas]